MTLQVALLGVDGIVLASDKQINVVQQEFNSTAVRSKILIDHDRKIAACWSGQHWPSFNLADRIVRTMTASDFQYPYPSLRAALQEIVSQPGVHGEVYTSAEVIVITIEEEPKAYEVTATID